MEKAVALWTWVDMSVAVDLGRDLTSQTLRNVSLPRSKALQRCGCDISKSELLAVVMIKIESPHSGISGVKVLASMFSFIGRFCKMSFSCSHK